MQIKKHPLDITILWRFKTFRMYGNLIAILLSFGLSSGSDRGRCSITIQCNAYMSTHEKVSRQTFRATSFISGFANRTRFALMGPVLAPTIRSVGRSVIGQELAPSIRFMLRERLCFSLPNLMLRNN